MSNPASLEASPGFFEQLAEKAESHGAGGQNDVNLENSGASVVVEDIHEWPKYSYASSFFRCSSRRTVHIVCTKLCTLPILSSRDSMFATKKETIQNCLSSCFHYLKFEMHHSNCPRNQVQIGLSETNHHDAATILRFTVSLSETQKMDLGLFFWGATFFDRKKFFCVIRTYRKTTLFVARDFPSPAAAPNYRPTPNYQPKLTFGTVTSWWWWWCGSGRALEVIHIWLMTLVTSIFPMDAVFTMISGHEVGHLQYFGPFSTSLFFLPMKINFVLGFSGLEQSF